MNTSGILGILLIVLLVFGLVAYSADMANVQHAEEIKAVTQQRDQALALTVQAEGQMQAAKQRAAQLELDNQRVTGELNATKQHAAQLSQQLGEKDQQIAGLQEKIAGLDGQLADLNTRYTTQGQELVRLSEQNQAMEEEKTALRAQLAALESPQIPVTGLPDNIGSGEVPEKVTPTSAPWLPIPGDWALAMLSVLVGMVVVGGGGVAAYHANSNHLVTVRMTRAEMKAFIRYQRERK